MCFLEKKLKKKIKRSDLSPIQKLHYFQIDSYPQKERIPVQSMYNIKLRESEKLIKFDMPYQPRVRIGRTKCVYHNSNIQVQFWKFKYLLSQTGNVQFKGQTIRDLLLGQCYLITLSPRKLKLHSVSKTIINKRSRYQLNYN